MSAVVSSVTSAAVGLVGATSTTADGIRIIDVRHEQLAAHAAALQGAREAIHRTGRSAVVDIWVDPREYAPGTKNQTIYK